MGTVLLCLLLCVSCNASSDSWFPWWGNDLEAPVALVTEPYIDIRTGPGRGYPIFYIAERGESVEVLKQRTDWVKVRNRKQLEGWVHIEQMALTLDQNDNSLNIDLANFDSFKQRKWEIGSLLGDFGGADAITAYAGWHFTRNLSIEAAYSETFGDFSNGSGATISLVHQPFPNWRYSPFFTLGGGVRETNPRSTLVSVEDRNDDTLDVGIGLRVYMSRHLMLRFQYKHYTVLTDRDDDEEVEEWKLGISTFF